MSTSLEKSDGLTSINLRRDFVESTLQPAQTLSQGGIPKTERFLVELTKEAKTASFHPKFVPKNRHLSYVTKTIPSLSLLVER